MCLQVEELPRHEGDLHDELLALGGRLHRGLEQEGGMEILVSDVDHRLSFETFFAGNWVDDGV